MTSVNVWTSWDLWLWAALKLSMQRPDIYGSSKAVSKKIISIADGGYIIGPYTEG